MEPIEYANLYVEKYTNRNLLLDFIVEREYIYFRNNGDYTESMKLLQYTPSMLLFQNVENLPISEGDIISVSMQSFIRHKENANRAHFDNTDGNEVPYNLFMTFSDGDWLAERFHVGEAFKRNRLRKQLTDRVVETWPNGTPCSLNNTYNNICIEVVDVGQGSTNLIYDGNALTIFDFGASIFASKPVLKNIVDDIRVRFHRFHGASLIISHWDCDHYNLLTVLDEELMRQLCCVFVPSEIITLTSKQIMNQLQNNCRYIRAFSSPAAKKGRSAEIVPVITKPNYVLYVGAKSKDTNKSGFALTIKSKQEVTILGADHTNRQIWEYIYPHTVANKSYERLHIVVPHHGGSCGKIKIKSLSERPGIAAISVGKNSYKHPHQPTMSTYSNLGFNVKRTDWERQKIFFQMK